MTQVEYKKYEDMDKELNTIYRRILIEYKEDTVFIKSLETSQKIWIQFRDAEMKMKYPNLDLGYYGSVRNMCWFIYLTDLTKSRVQALNMWLEGIEEGDVCAGSVKTKH